MNKLKELTFFCTIVLLVSMKPLYAQTIYVDAVNGKDGAKGTISDPLPGLEQAISMTNGFSGNELVTIKLTPGLYVVSHEMIIKTAKAPTDDVKFTIEATIMPDDPEWQPAKMPVIQSIAPNNSKLHFTHSIGFFIAKENVSIKGLKFVGNASPDVAYYYPINRESGDLNGLEVSQCYFIGEKNSTRLQSGLWANGAGIHVDHCIFYNCRNAMVLIQSIKDFSLTNSIIYGAYESGIWFGNSKEPFVFNENIVTHCNFFWVRPNNTQPAYTFKNSLITENNNYMGYIAGELIPAEKNDITEIGIRKKGIVKLVEIKTEPMQPHDYLNLSTESDGRDIPAGIFKRTGK
ncbi:MAG TPA: right-handed parallel beta-helix repeat-containing protein [Mucilaginibacter sp.]